MALSSLRYVRRLAGTLTGEEAQSPHDASEVANNVHERASPDKTPAEHLVVLVVEDVADVGTDLGTTS